MFIGNDDIDVYKRFYSWTGNPGMFKPRKDRSLEYSDLAPLAYIHLAFEGSSCIYKVKHLLIDEMQDYTPIQYKVLQKLFNCRKTILGDIGQSLIPYTSSDASMIRKVFVNGVVMKLSKSYRSTYEIAAFINEFKDSSYDSLGIICRSERLASELKEFLSVYVDDINKILDFGSDIIKKIDVLYTERCFGDLVFQGMVAISGKENLIRTLTPASYSLRIMNPAIANNYFLSANADPATANKNKPFVTQLLYWNPNISISDKKDTESYFSPPKTKGLTPLKRKDLHKTENPYVPAQNLK